MKYVDVMIGFREVPDEVALCIDVSNCPYKCEDCHSKYLREDIGVPFNSRSLEEMLHYNAGATALCVLGGDSSIEELTELFKHSKKAHPELKTCWYSGNPDISTADPFIEYLDFLKVGPYIKKLGGLDSPTTNQRFYSIRHGKALMYEDITYKFRKNNSPIN